MTIGSSLFLLAVGAILRYAVTDTLEAINLETVGLILMIVGAVGLVLGLFLMTREDRGTTVERERRAPPRDQY